MRTADIRNRAVKLNARWANQLRHVTADQWLSTNPTMQFQADALKGADTFES